MSQVLNIQTIYTFKNLKRCLNIAELGSYHQNTICKTVVLYWRLFKLVVCLKEAD